MLIVMCQAFKTRSTVMRYVVRLATYFVLTSLLTTNILWSNGKVSPLPSNPQYLAPTRNIDASLERGGNGFRPDAKKKLIVRISLERWRKMVQRARAAGISVEGLRKVVKEKQKTATDMLELVDSVWTWIEEAERTELCQTCMTSEQAIQRGKFTPTHYLSELNVIGYPDNLAESPVKTKYVDVYVNPDSEGHKVAYLGQDHWGSGVFVPAESNIEILSVGFQDCCPLIMYLEDSGGIPYIYLHHVSSYEIHAQIEHIIDNLKAEGLKPKRIIFSPRLDSGKLDKGGYQNAVKALQNFASEASMAEPVKMLLRKKVSRATAWVGKKGWVIQYVDESSQRRLTDSTWTSPEVPKEEEPLESFYAHFGEATDFNSNTLTRVQPTVAFQENQFAVGLWPLSQMESQPREPKIHLTPYTETKEHKLADVLALNPTGTLALTMARVVKDKWALKLIDVTTGENVKTFSPTILPLFQFAIFSSDGEKILTGSDTDTGELILWDTQTGRKIKGKESADTITAGTFTADNSKIIVAKRNQVSLLDTQTFTLENRFVIPFINISVMTVIPDQSMIVVGSDKGTIKVWDIETREEIFSFQGHDSEVTSLSFPNGSSTLLSASKDKTAKLWDLHLDKTLGTVFSTGSPEVVGFLYNSGKPIIATGWNKEQREISLADADGVIRTYSFDSIRKSPFAPALFSLLEPNPILETAL